MATGKMKNSYCSTYLVAGRRLINKKRKMLRHLKQQPNDLQNMERYHTLGGK